MGPTRNAPWIARAQGGWSTGVLKTQTTRPVSPPILQLNSVKTNLLLHFPLPVPLDVPRGAPRCRP